MIRKQVQLLSACLWPGLALMALLLLCELVVKMNLVSSYLLAAPSQVMDHMLTNIQSLRSHLYVTSAEALLGFFIAGFAALCIGISFSVSRFLDKAFFPLLVALKCTPLVALAPFLALGFSGNSIFLKAIFSSFICFFPIIISFRAGLNHVDREALDLFRSFSASNRKILVKLQLPSSLPHLFAGLKTASTFSVIGAVVGEFSLSDAGLGFYISEASNYGNTAAMYAAIFLLIILGLTFFGTIGLLYNLVSRIYRIDHNSSNSSPSKFN